MAIELSQSTNYEFTGNDWALNLSNSANRRDLGPVAGKTFESAVEIVAGLGLTRFGTINRGKNRILKIYGGNVDLHGYGRGLKNDVRVGFAAEYSRNPDATGELVPRAIIVRESRSFNEEAFAQGADRLLKYDEDSGSPKWLRGHRVYGAGVVAGIAIGAVSLMGYGSYYHYDFDAIALGTSAGAGGFAGYFTGDYMYKVDQWHLNRRVPDLDQYYGNHKALKRLESIAGHLETLKMLTKIEEALKMQSVKLPQNHIAHIWRTDAGIASSRVNYNFWSTYKGAGDKEAVKADIFNDIVDRYKALAA